MLSPGNFLMITHQFNHFYSQKLSQVADAHEMSRVELDILLFLHNNPSYDTARDIVEYRLIAKSYVSKAVDLLLRRRFLNASEDPKDRRILHLTIRPEASCVLKESLDAQQAIFRSALEGIGDDERNSMEKIMIKMSRNISESI